MVRVRAVVFVVLAALAGTLGFSSYDGSTVALEVPTVTLHVAPDEVVRTETVSFWGRAGHSRPGSVVRLQRRTDAGWVTVADGQTSAWRTYRFNRRPALGAHRFRVVKPRQYGQPRVVSPRVSVTVHDSPSVQEPTPEPTQEPAPELTVASSTAHDDQNRSVLVLSGQVSGLTDPVVTLERRWGSDGTWYPEGSEPVAPGADGAFEFRISDWAVTQFRVVVPAEGDQPELVSQVFANAREPYRLDLNAGVTMEGLYAEEHAATVLVDVTAGDEVTLAGGSMDTQWKAWVTDPDGQAVGSFRNGNTYNLLRFEPVKTGTYVIDVTVDSPWSSLTVWASTPKRVPTTLDGPAVVLENDIPGQVVEAVFPMAAGQAVLFDDNGTTGGPKETFHGPDGTALDPWLDRRYALDDVFRAEADGEYAYRYTDSWVDDSLSVVSLPTYGAVVDGPMIEVPPSSEYPAVVEVPLTSGQRISIGRGDGYAEGDLFLPDGTRFGDSDWVPGVFQPQASGAHHLILEPTDATSTLEITSPVEVDGLVDTPTAVDNSAHLDRLVWVRFHGEAGQMVYPGDSAAEGCTGHRFLLDAEGRELPWTVDGYQLGWLLESTGDYIMQFRVCDDWQGTVTPRLAREVALPSDGTPTRVALGDPDGLVFAKVTDEPRTVMQLTASEIDAELVDWIVTVGVSGGRYADLTYLWEGDTSSTYWTPGSGTSYVGLTAEQGSGGLTLTLAPTG